MALRVDAVDLVRDRTLVERFQLGDPAAFDTLYRRYFGRLVRFCQKRVGDPLEAEEIAQEAFARALRALPTFEGERRFYPWMTVIAGRLCVDSHRRRSRSEPSSQVDLGVIEGGQEKVVDAVDVEILSTALARLAPRHREVLHLREQQGRSYQEIADHYEVSLGTVEALLFRARKALKREFMAVVGDERNWAAIPVFGVVLRKIATWKARASAVSAGLPSLAGPVVAGVMAVTVVTGAVGLGRSAGGDERPAQTTPVIRLHPGAVAATADSTVHGTAEGAAGAPTGKTTGTGASSPASGPAEPTPAGRPAPGPPVDGPVEIVGADEADDQPVQTEIAGIFVGVDPAAAAAEVEARLKGYTNEPQQGARP